MMTEPQGRGAGEFPPELLARAVTRDFPGDAGRMLERLAAYAGPEPVRVRLAVVKLARGDPARLATWLERASADHQDVIDWAEFPLSRKAKLNEWSVRTAATQDAERHRAWLADLAGDDRG